MKTGFAVSGSPSGVEFRLFGARTGAPVPLLTFFEYCGNRAAFIGRLYYRNEILTDLKPYLPQAFVAQCELSDAALAVGAYSQWGFAGLERLEGDFAIALWDGAKNALVGCRDPMGGYPLFWTSHGQTAAFSTMFDPLLDMLPRRRMSMDHLADFLMSPTSSNERASESCAYEGINRVLPGTIVSIDILTGSAKRHIYWNWLDKVSYPAGDKLEDIAAHYGDLLRTAVRERISSPTASHLSGGMDSTAVSLLALDLIRSGKGHAPLHALSLVYERLPELSRERPYIESVLGDADDMIGHRIVADDILHFDDFADPPPHDEPCVGLWCMGTERVLTNEAAALGAHTILTGRGGDDLLDIMPFYLTDLVRKARLRSAWKGACQWAEQWGMSPWRVLYPFGIANLVPAWRHSLGGRLLSRGMQAGLAQQDDWSIPPWIAPRFARRHALGERAVEGARQIYRRCESTPVSIALHALERRTGDVYRWILAAPLGVAVSHPFLDFRVVRFALGMQTRAACCGRGKPVLAEAVRGVLPENIRTRRDKRSFNQVYYLGLNRNLRYLETMVAGAPIDDLDMIRKDVLIRCMQDAALGVADPRRLQRLNLTLSLIRWLVMTEDGPAKPVEVPQVIRYPLHSDHCREIKVTDLH